MDCDPTTSATVLVVDDDPVVCEMLTMMLEIGGYRAHSATNGREAINQLRQAGQAPCLILLDLMMPVMNGWDFKASQQQDPRLATIPVVVISADRSIEHKAASIHADGYLPKPIDLDNLLDTVGQYCR